MNEKTDQNFYITIDMIKNLASGHSNVKIDINF